MTSEERRRGRFERRQAKRQAKKDARLLHHDCFEEVFSYEHLYLSYRKCRLGVAWKGSTQKVIARAPLEVFRIWNQLDKGNWKSDGFYEFDLSERGKLRHIKSVTQTERIVQKCLCDYALTPVLKPTFIYDNGASTKDKGYHFAIDRCEKHLHDHFRKYGQDGYVLTFDFSKFFDNVSHKLCKQITEDAFTDPKIVKLIQHFIDAFGEIGLGLGSQISQTFALASASRLDHYIKEVLQIHGYGRYMDDGYLIHPSKEYLQDCLTEIQQICDELKITLNLKKTHIIKLSHGFTFLKCRFYLTETGKVIKKIYKKSVTKMRRKLKKFKALVLTDHMDQADVFQGFQSWRAYALHFDAWNTIQNMSRLYQQLFRPISDGLFIWKGI